MMQAPAALPLHMMLTMMQSGVSPFASSGWSGLSPGFPGMSNPMMQFLPEWMRPKTPFEKGLDTLQNINQQFSEQSLAWLKPQPEKLQAPDPFAWLKQFQPKESALPPKGSKRTASEESEKAASNPFTDYLPHFMQPEFLSALGEKAMANSTGFMAGMQAYLTSDYTRVQPEYDVLWQRGSATLYDLAPDMTDGLAVLMVPSLINQSYVLDLYPEASFAQYLKSQGLRPLILDWGTPGGDEREFGTEDYITAYALAALQELRESHDGPIALLGYCMGGVFATAMAQLAPLFVDALILLATPWDFKADDMPGVMLQPTTQMMLRNWIKAQNPVPSLVTQMMFHLIDPWRIQEKYSRYPDLTNQEKQHFLAVEQWVNDGIPLAQKVAEECLVDWPQGNILQAHQWKVGRRWIDPARIECPTLCVIPTKDKIVPVGCALPLTTEIPRCDVLKPESGHIGMLVGRNAKATLWKPLVHWLKERF